MLRCRALPISYRLLNCSLYDSVNFRPSKERTVVDAPAEGRLTMVLVDFLDRRCSARIGI